LPKETFFNLPDEKREHITKVAIEEFAAHEYGDVSISRFVARAGIAKGSFYQYFEDKEDLHEYLLNLIVQKKWEMFSLEHPDPQHTGIFHYLHWMAQAGVQFELAYPELVRIGYRAMSRNSYPQKFQKRAQEDAHLFYRRLVAKGKEQGDISPEIDEDLAAFIFDAFFSGLGQYMAQRVAAHEEEWQGTRAFFEMPEMVRVFDQVVNILEHGMGLSHPVKANDDLSGEQKATEEVAG
jgi:TetR/AcrR family transcriptional regulator